MRAIQRALATAVLLLITGCAGGVQKPPSIAFDRTNSAVRSIAVVTPAVPARPILVSLAPVSGYGLLGIFGTEGEANVQKEHAEHLAVLLANQKFSPQGILLDDVVAAVKAKGYVVTIVQADRHGADYLSQPPAQVDADAYLDVALVNYGYATTATSAPYQPVVGIKFKLVHAQDGKVLMMGSFGYSIFGSDVHPAAAYDVSRYTDFDGGMDRVVEGIEDGLSQGANAAGAALN